MEFKITPEIVRIHAHICGDGWISKGKSKYSRWNLERYNRKKKTYFTWRVGYSNNEIILLDEFQSDIKKILPRNFIYRTYNNVSVFSKELFYFLSQLGASNSYNWFISRKLLRNSKLTAIWLKAFFDDEATVENSKDSHRRIRIKSVNKRGLLDVKRSLEKLNIDSSIAGLNNDTTWYLTISHKPNILRYKYIIGFNHPKKEIKLEKLFEILRY